MFLWAGFSFIFSLNAIDNHKLTVYLSREKDNKFILFANT